MSFVVQTLSVCEHSLVPRPSRTPREKGSGIRSEFLVVQSQCVWKTVTQSDHWV